VFFLQNNYQAAANEFREALNGDLEPKWTEVWAHVNLGKIFDMTGQRERAVNEYTLAMRTKDNTQHAQEEAAKYLKTPYERKRTGIRGGARRSARNRAGFHRAHPRANWNVLVALPIRGWRETPCRLVTGGLGFDKPGIRKPRPGEAPGAVVL